MKADFIHSKCDRVYSSPKTKACRTGRSGRVSAEPAFVNNRFDAAASDDDMVKWSKFIGLHRINNFFDMDTNRLFTHQDMDTYTTTLAPVSLRGTPAARAWADDLMCRNGPP